ncbi:MAG: hypothetical protein ACRED1_01920, partial [Limisphaerales bacterium]
GYYGLAFVALAGIIISFYYYFGVIRAIYWSRETPDLSPIRLSWAAKLPIVLCIAGMFWLGTFPNYVVNLANQAAIALEQSSANGTTVQVSMPHPPHGQSREAASHA